MKELAFLLTVTCSVVGCAVSTERFAAEYSTEYVLAADARVWTDCRVWTGWYSLNIGGPEAAHCFVSPQYDSALVRLSPQQQDAQNKRMTIFKKGSVVRIERIFTIVHQGTQTAEMRITDADSGKTTKVYDGRWPGTKAFLTERARK